MNDFVLLEGDCLEILKELPDDSVDSLVTDPPAGISFMGKSWDSDKGGRKQWVAWMTEVMSECLRVLKPGAHGLVWALPRTSHWTASALEDAGFEIRDVVTHLFGSGFPKSSNVAMSGANQARSPRQSFGGDAATGASRFFYCAKVSSSERHAGLDRNVESRRMSDARPNSGDLTGNHHPTVKPQKLMRYLIKLITPPGGAVLDPFMGSGSTGLAAKYESFRFIGIEKEQEYMKIAERRLNNAALGNNNDSSAA